MAKSFSAEEIEERVRNTAWMVENHPPETEMNVQVQELDRLVNAAATVARLEEREAALTAALNAGNELWGWLPFDSGEDIQQVAQKVRDIQRAAISDTGEGWLPPEKTGTSPRG